MQKSESFIKTFIRIRPPATQSIFREPNDDRILNCCDKPYRFSHVFAPQATDEEIFQKIGYELIENAVNGYNSTLFAYGQTGTGKTYTMTGNNQKIGLVQRCVNLLIRRLKSDQFQYSSLKISYIEIYNQSIKDLLSEKENKIMIRQLSKSGFHVEGLQAIDIFDDEGFNKELKRGLLKRSVKTTKMNEVSSRSHSIMTLFLGTKKLDDEKGLLVRASKLNFVDLAGSEKQKQTQVSGCELKQASSINKSLTTLSLVISKLCEKPNKTLHIPYRQSILTKILKDSIGGNSMTTFIGTISAQKIWVSETISTLLFLERLKNVKNIVQINEKIEGKEEELIKKIKTLQDKVAEMQQQIDQLTKTHIENQQKINLSQIHIKELEERLIFRGPIDHFFGPYSEQSEVGSPQIFEKPNQQEFNEAVSNTQSKSSLTVIQQIDQNTSSISKEQKSRQIYHTQVKQAKKSKITISQNISSGKKERKSNFWQLQNQFLREQIKKYDQQDARYDSLLKIIQENINDLKFDNAAKLILYIQAEKLKKTQIHLVDYRRKIAQIIAMTEQQQIQIRNHLYSVRSLELDNISKRSIYLSNENKLKKIIESYEEREKQFIENIEKLKSENCFQRSKFEEEKLQIYQQNQEIIEQNQFLKDENNKLYEIITIHKKKLSRMSANGMDDSRSTKTQSSCGGQFEEQNERLKQKIEEMQDMIENEFMPEMETMQRQLKDKSNQNQQLFNHNQYLKQQLSQLQLQLNKCKANHQKQLHKKQTYQLDGHLVTFEDLHQKYQKYTFLLERQKQEKVILEAKLSTKIQQLQIQKLKFENEKQASKQAQTYYRYELKVKGLQISKLKIQKTRMQRQRSEKSSNELQNSMVIDDLRQKMNEANKKILQLSNVQSINQELQRNISQLHRIMVEKQNLFYLETQAQKQIIQKMKQSHEKVIKCLEQQKASAQMKWEAAQANFNKLTKKYLKNNEIYRSQQCYFYRYKRQYEENLKNLRSDNTRLLSILNQHQKCFG